MSKKSILYIISVLLATTLNAQTTPDFSNVPGVVVVHSPKSTGIFRGTPSIAKIPNGNIVVSNDIFGETITKNSTDIFISRDNGLTWTKKTSVSGAVWSGLFFHNNVLYLLGADTSAGANLVIRSSTDQGSTWSGPTIIAPGACHGSSTTVTIANGRIYKAYEHHGDDLNGKWMSGNKSFIISAPANSDLMNKNNWTITNEVAKPAWLDGTGWLESNAVMGRDGKIKGISRLASFESIYAGYYSVGEDNQIETDSLQKIQFWGGASKFNIRYDARTDMYWSLSNYVPDSIHAPGVSGGGIRSVLALTCSRDLKKWDIKAIVLAHEDINNVGFQYVDFLIDGNDIIFVSRTSFDDGIGGADSYHNANFMTFHRIENFATATTPEKWRYLLPADEKWTGITKPLDRSNNAGESELNPILISHPGQLVTLSEEVYKGNTFAGKYFKLTNDIDLNGYNFLPIGWYVTMSNNRPFSGNLDGNGYCIKNLCISRNDDVYASNGLFGYIKNSTIKRLGIAGNSQIWVGGICAGIAAYANASTITDCFNNANVSASSQTGGIVGYATSSPIIKNCYNTGNIKLSTTSTAQRYVGGIIGFVSSGTINNCYNTGEITTLNGMQNTTGGIAGNFAGTPISCYFSTESVLLGNSIGTSMPSGDMKASPFVDLINSGLSTPSFKLDNHLQNSGYPLLAWQTDGLNSLSKPSLNIPDYQLYQNYPNPVSEYTTIYFKLTSAENVTIALYDESGKLIEYIAANQYQSGTHSILYNASHLPVGKYFYVLSTPRLRLNKDMIVVR